ncbi:hypothetical protein K438DRAFT_1725596 [Mycena galopus ATCC 62051]|nr:hypothetical protein K438DRAFT_1725596 [Mycena galopus ATCC 62051]
MTPNGPPMKMNTKTKTVVVLGGAYGGARAAQIIAAGLPDGWRVVLVDRNSHVNHVYILPRLAVLPGHEHKAFIPYDNVFNPPDGKPNEKHVFLHARVTSLAAHSLTFARPGDTKTETLEFDYAVYALGSHLPAPLNLWHTAPDSQRAAATTTPEKHAHAHAHTYTGTKSESVIWLRAKQHAIEAAASVLIVGGGALGIQFATDIADIHPTKRVTLLHSRARLLPRFDGAMHSEVFRALESANVDVILGERLDLASVPVPVTSQDNTTSGGTVRTTTGRVIDADLVLLCTGQTPNTDLLRALDPRTVDPSTGLARVGRTMQLALVPPPPSPALAPAPLASSAPPTAAASSPPSPAAPAASTTAEGGDVPEPDEDAAFTTPYPHIFVIGDAADAFGAVPAGHNAYYQAEVAGRNVLALIAASSLELGARLERYTPGPPAIKVSLGLRKNVYQVNGVVGVGKERLDDLNAAAMWAYFGCPVREGAGGRRIC